MESQLRSHLATVLRYEDPAVRVKGLEAMPVERLKAEAHEAVEIAAEFGEGDDVPCYEDCPVESLAVWFKGEFFSWVNAPACWNCGNEETLSVGVTHASAAEARHGATRVENYRCPSCGAAVTFPRYNDPVKLFETRRGRCGEWANAFTCLCRCLDVEARFILDFADHVWTEYHLSGQQRWIHVDCCECIIDKPALYEKGS